MSEYIKQAEDFLKSTGTEFTIVYQFTGPYFQGDKENRDVYRFTLRNAKGEYSGTFGDSINNTKRRAFMGQFRLGRAMQISCQEERAMRAVDVPLIKSGQFFKLESYNPPMPSAYDILACLEKYELDTFEAWTREMGYDEQPLKEYSNVFRIWNACVEQYRGLSRIFTPEQMDQLREIQ